jgi:hypothetical protein
MSAFAVAFLVLASLLAGAGLGFWFSTIVPEHHLSAHSKDSVRQSVAVLSTLTALVLGLVVGSAKSSYDAKGDALTAMAADIILLDRNLAQYGPETAEARKLLRDSTEAGIKAIWADDAVRFAALEYAGAGGVLEGIQRQIRGLAPQNDAQRELKARAIEVAGDLSKTRWLTLVRSGGTIPIPFLAVVVLWLALMFVGLGLLGARNGTVAAAALAVALAVSAAIFLILELDTPYSGLITLSDAPLRLALQHLGR